MERFSKFKHRDRGVRSRSRVPSVLTNIMNFNEGLKSFEESSNRLTKLSEVALNRGVDSAEEILENLRPLAENPQTLRAARNLLTMSDALAPLVNRLSPYFIYGLLLTWSFFSHCTLLDTNNLKLILNDQLKTFGKSQLTVFCGYAYASVGLLRYMRSGQGEMLRKIHSVLFLLFPRVALPCMLMELMSDWGVNSSLSWVLTGSAAVSGLSALAKMPQLSNLSLALVFGLSSLLAFKRGVYEAALGSILVMIGEFFALGVRGTTAWLSGYAWRLLFLTGAMFLFATSISHKSVGVATGNVEGPIVASLEDWLYDPEELQQHLSRLSSSRSSSLCTLCTCSDSTLDYEDVDGTEIEEDILGENADENLQVPP